MPKEGVDVEQFVKLMQELLKDSQLVYNEEFVTVLVDLFFRINKENDDDIKFEDITTYLIDHEIAFDAETSGACTGQMNQMEYFPAEIDKTKLVPHHNYIEKVLYFQQIDLVFLYEENQRNIKLYEGSTLHFLHEIPMPFSILAIEFIADKNSICVSLSNRTFMFFEAQNIRTKIYTLADYNNESASNKVRKFNLPST